MLTKSNLPVECNSLSKAVPDVSVQDVEADVGPGAFEPSHENPPLVYVKIVRDDISTLVWCLPIEFIR